ncbi:hypothetical protein FGO68_gene13764 [Halteria grandinella]|uniref:Uncharacterized protein n=1 Tax=Halteria grandinella TaxID=5974 RepID=A0A8J8PA07_HALGN|nr:hypothetical protein FGO68_gene13764 [Halteria grandinella]
MRVPRVVLSVWKLHAWVLTIAQERRQVLLISLIDLLELTQILSHLETAHDFPFKLWQVDNPSTYSVSVLTTTYALAQTDAQDCLLRNNISDPLFPTFSHCILCTPQYFSQNYTTHFENRVVYNEIGEPVGREVKGQRGNSCVRQCRPGKYQRVTLTQEEQEVSEVLSTYGIGRGICANCSDSCVTCLFGGDEGCITCRYGYGLEIIDPETMTGKCILSVFQQDSDATTTNMSIYVTGDRSKKSASDDGKFSDLLSALKFAYSLNQRKLNLQTVRVFIDPSVTHYVAPSDFETTNPLIEEQALINANYSLIIMQAFFVKLNINQYVFIFIGLMGAKIMMF